MASVMVRGVRVRLMATHTRVRVMFEVCGQYLTPNAQGSIEKSKHSW